MELVTSLPWQARRGAEALYMPYKVSLRFMPAMTPDVNLELVLEDLVAVTGKDQGKFGGHSGIGPVQQPCSAWPQPSSGLASVVQ